MRHFIELIRYTIVACNYNVPVIYKKIIRSITVKKSDWYFTIYKDIRDCDITKKTDHIHLHSTWCLGSFQASWRLPNSTPIPKGPPSSSVANCRPISITSLLSKVFERLVSVRLRRFMERVCASKHQVCLSEMSGYLWGIFVRVPCTAKYIGEWAAG